MDTLRWTYTLAVLLGCLATAAALPTTYTCPATCVPPACRCAATQPPLPVDQMPQFLLFTHDDTTGPLSVGLINRTVAGLTNPNGCPLPATFFTMYQATACKDVQEAHAAGSEIATHTWSHMAMPDAPGRPFIGGLGSTEKDIVAVRDWLVSNCSIPKDHVVGFRSPYLVHNPAYRRALKANGFLYDSSINEHWPMPSSPSGRERLWPYSMDAGIPQDCAWIAGNVCQANETYPGLWEVPVWVLQNDNYPTPAYTMDPCTGENGVCDTTELLKYFFELSYNSNKAPVPILIHSPWLNQTKNLDATRAFMQYVTSTYKDAYFVTNHQLIQWMQNPVPKDRMAEWLGCGPGGVAAGANGMPAMVPTTTPETTTPTVTPATTPSKTVGAAADPAADSDGGSDSLSTGAIVGIAVGGAALLGLVVGGGIFAVKRRNSKRNGGGADPSQLKSVNIAVLEESSSGSLKKTSSEGSPKSTLKGVDLESGISVPTRPDGSSLGTGSTETSPARARPASLNASPSKNSVGSSGTPSRARRSLVATPSSPTRSPNLIEGSLRLSHLASMQKTGDPVMEWIESQTQQTPRALRRLKSSRMPAHVASMEFSWADARIISPLGLGSFGKVFLGELHQSPVALKLLVDIKALGVDAAAGLQESSSAALAVIPQDRLVEEVGVMASLNHPNVVKLQGFCLTPPCLATEYCSQGSVFDLLERALTEGEVAQMLEWKRLVTIAAEAAAGLQHMHARSPAVLHRDVNTKNLLIAKDGTVKVAERGLSRLVGEATRNSSTASVNSQNPRWLSPEVLAGERPTTAADVYSFGVVMWELLTWQLPWTNTNVWSIVGDVQRGRRPALPLPTELLFCQVHGIPAGFDAYIGLMRRCWAQQPEARPDFRTVAAELRAMAS